MVDDPDEFDAALGPVVRSLDTPTRRAELAQAVVELAEAGRVDAEVAAAAMIDLATPDSALFTSSVAEAARWPVSRRAPTPQGRARSVTLRYPQGPPDERKLER
jgi:hypothetical protein